jgi:Acyl-CoA dehydrogenase, C-terminal domain
MNLELGEEAIEYGRVAHRAFEAAGTDALLQAAERQPAQRESLFGSVLADIGAWDLDPRGSAEELEAAAALCRGAGYWTIAYPVAERLCRRPEDSSDGLIIVSGNRPAAPIDNLSLTWVAADVDGRLWRASARPGDTAVRKSAFVANLDLDPMDGDGGADVPLGVVLPCWTLLGMLDRAMELARAYVLQREQFGQLLAKFQGVQFQLTDAEVERAGLEELAKYALWSVETGQEDALLDAFALRLAALEAADTVFRVAHQLHGAIGFCDETTLSWVSRYSQPLRRLPLGLSATRHQLTSRLGRRSLSGIFSGVKA